METFEEKSELLRFIENSIRAGDATSDTDELTVNNDVVAYVSELLQCNVESLCAEEIRLNEVRRALQERKSALVLEVRTMFSRGVEKIFLFFMEPSAIPLNHRWGREGGRYVV